MESIDTACYAAGRKSRYKIWRALSVISPFIEPIYPRDVMAEAKGQIAFEELGLGSVLPPSGALESA
jgi:hypothetical protein